VNVLSQALAARLKGDATLAAMLGSYRSEPCVFSADTVPGDAPRPYLVWAGAMHDEPFGGKVEDTIGRELYLDIRAIADATGSSQKIDSIAERVRTLLHKVPLVVTGYSNTIARCIAGPLDLATDPRLIGRVMTFQWTLE